MANTTNDALNNLEDRFQKLVTRKKTQQIETNALVALAKPLPRNMPIPGFPPISSRRWWPAVPMPGPSWVVTN
jgi:hypothetical protein